MKRSMIFLAAVMWAATAWSSVSEVREFRAADGRSEEMYKAALEAEAIQTKLGATVFIGTDLVSGNLQYVVTFPDWAAWAAFGTKMQASKEWDAFAAKYFVANPSSTQVGDTVFVDTPVVAKTQPVGLIYSWKIMPGKFDAFMAIAQESVKLHNALGASAGINIDDLNNVHYELTFDSWASWAKFGAALQKSQEWTALLKKANDAPTAELVRVLRIDQYTKP